MSVIIIYPSELYNGNSSLLKGTVRFDSNCVYFFVLNNVVECRDEQISNIGFCKNVSHTNYGKLRESMPKQTNWIELQIADNCMDVTKLFIKDQEFNVNNVDVTFVQYDETSFLKSKLLNYNQEDGSSTKDCFQALQQLVQTSHKDQSQLEENVPKAVSSLGVVVEALEKVLNICRFFKIFTFFSMYNHFTSMLECMLWCLTSIQARKHKLKLLNYFTCLVLDILVGAYLLHYFHRLLHSQDELFTLISNKCESLVSSLHQLVVWLQGNPAGLKLNHPLTFLLGKFYIYHIQLWWSFLVLCRPLLELMYRAFLLVGYCGFTFQLCIVSDLLTLATFHAYCIYVYAARVYNIQLQSLLILTRVFIGKKRNPEPFKVDSVPYTTEQLFIGTLAFTVLLFLLPTTLIYYVVFTLIRLVIIAVEGCLNRIKTGVRTLPLYVTVLYLLKSPQTTSTIKLVPQQATGHNRTVACRVHILASPVHQSLLKTIQMTVPDPLNGFEPVPWSSLTTSVLKGKPLQNTGS
uniref:Phosphatidylinositol N-acetylglucosaminyltransferase subunit Q n=1 Tax=Cacopsylla melanoneura TaxID=428564 RepID=A0A8D9A771_9HEMI